MKLKFAEIILVSLVIVWGRFVCFSHIFFPLCPSCLRAVGRLIEAMSPSQKRHNFIRLGVNFRSVMGTLEFIHGPQIGAPCLERGIIIFIFLSFSSCYSLCRSQLETLSCYDCSYRCILIIEWESYFWGVIVEPQDLKIDVGLRNHPQAPTKQLKTIQYCVF